MRWMIGLAVVAGVVLAAEGAVGTRHSAGSRYQSYEGLVMCGYQGWFRAEGDGSGRGWVHYTTKKTLDFEHLKVDLWPEVKEYEKTYETPFRNKDGTGARLFSSWDRSTVDVHFRWMKEYGIDGVFMQRFFGVTRTAESRRKERVILGHAMEASRKNGRAIAVMYDLSGLRDKGEDCSSIIQDWKELVDELKITSGGADQTYLYHRGQPLVAIWGVGFPDRKYSIHTIGIERLIEFLKNDPEYGGCSVMLGVPTYFRELKRDCAADAYLHEIIAKVDVVMPWMVARFSSKDPKALERYGAQVKEDLAWCAQKKVDYAPCVFPGFSWYNLSRQEFGGGNPMGQIPRQKGRFYWGLFSTAIEAGAKMIYVAMFDEIDEGTAIFKCTNEPPVTEEPGKLLDYEGVRSDHYLWLTGEAGKMLRGERKVTGEIPARAEGAK